MGNVEEHNYLASELLSEVKASATRWFFIALAELIVIVVLIIAMIVVPVEEVSVENGDGGNANYIGGDLEGGLYNGESDLQEKTGSGQ